MEQLTVKPGLVLVQRSGRFSPTYSIQQNEHELGQIKMSAWKSRASLELPNGGMHTIEREKNQATTNKAAGARAYRLGDHAVAQVDDAWNQVKIDHNGNSYNLVADDQQGYTLSDDGGEVLMRVNLGSRTVFPNSALLEILAPLSGLLAFFALFLLIIQRRHSVPAQTPSSKEN